MFHLAFFVLLYFYTIQLVYDNNYKFYWEDFEIDEEPCNFFMEYTKDKPLKTEEQNRSKNLTELFKKSYWLKNTPECDDYEPEICVGGCNKGYSYKKVSYSYKERNLCYDCFIDKNEELAKKYNQYIPLGKCLIQI